MIELIGGLLSGMGASPMPDYAGGNGTVLMAIKIGAFRDPTDFATAAAAFADRVVQDEDGHVDPHVLVPGQLETQTLKDRSINGVRIPEKVRADLTALAAEHDVDLGRFAIDPSLVHLA